jgi:hypothetical protein
VRIFLLLATVAIVAPAPFAQSAVVTVVISELSGIQDFGSGFVFNDRGEVLTCYHVVQGATRVRVYYGDRFYDAKATGISPSRDVAGLQLVGAAAPTKYIPIAYTLPSNLLAQQLFVRGFAVGMFGQQIPARATQDHFATSQEMKGARGERLFASQNVPLLPISITAIFKGMSGAPVIDAEGKAIGIVSGSLLEGGSIAWAIAAENSRNDNLQNVDAPNPGFSWPPLTLMAVGWQNLRRQSGLGENLAARLDDLRSSTDSAANSASRVCRNIGPVLSNLNNQRSTFDRYRLDGVRLANLDGVPGGAALNNEIVSLQNRVQPLMDAASGEADQALSDWQSSGQKMTEVSTEISRLLDSLPRTPANAALIASVRESIGDINRRLADNLQAAQRARRPDTDRTEMVTVGDVRQKVEEVQGNWKGFQTVYCGLFPGQVGFVQELTVNYRRLLSADLIGAH